VGRSRRHCVLGRRLTLARSFTVEIIARFLMSLVLESHMDPHRRPRKGPHMAAHMGGLWIEFDRPYVPVWVGRTNGGVLLSLCDCRERGWLDGASA
jgi:hypothetical protein